MEWTTLAVAGMSLIGTLAGTFGGILVSNKLTTYRIEQLERKVAAHNSLVERTYKLEGQMTEVQHDIEQFADHQEHGYSDSDGSICLFDLRRQSERRGIFDCVHCGHRLLLRHPGRT